jgi:hypothetical protein
VILPEPVLISTEGVPETVSVFEKEPVASAAKASWLIASAKAVTRTEWMIFFDFIVPRSAGVLEYLLFF